jgi:hypothetical protein
MNLSGNRLTKSNSLTTQWPNHAIYSPPQIYIYFSFYFSLCFMSGCWCCNTASLSVSFPEMQHEERDPVFPSICQRIQRWAALICTLRRSSKGQLDNCKGCERHSKVADTSATFRQGPELSSLAECKCRNAGFCNLLRKGEVQPATGHKSPDRE